jgi:hypothetical protein
MRHALSAILVLALIVLALSSSDSRSTSKPAAATPAPRPVAVTDEQLLSELESEAASLNSFNSDGWLLQGKDGVLTELSVFDKWADLLTTADVRADARVKKAAIQLRQRVGALQQKEFPKMRKAWASDVNNTMWEHDVTAQVLGSKATTLSLVGGAFAANRNIKAVQETLSPILRRLRFRRLQFKWIPSASEYTYYNYDVPEDNVVVASR